MTNIDIEALRKHIGAKVVEEDIAAAAPPRGMIVTFDHDEEAPREGEAIAPG